MQAFSKIIVLDRSIIFQSGVMSKVVELLHQSADVMILTPALRTAGNIVTGSDSQTEAMINLGLLNVFPKLLRHNKPNIVKVMISFFLFFFCLQWKIYFFFRKQPGQFPILQLELSVRLKKFSSLDCWVI